MPAESFTSLDTIGGENQHFAEQRVTASPPPRSLVQRFAEDFGSSPWPSRWLDDLKAFGDGGAWIPIGGAAGTVNDRKGGRDLPIFWSEIDLRGFRVHSRYLWDLNPFMIGFGGALVGYHVRKGYGWQACLKGKRKTPYPTELAPSNPLVTKAQHILDSWRDANQWPLQSREAFRRWRRDGEVFGRLGYGGQGELPWFRFVEPEQVGSPDGDTEGPASFGIEKDEHDQAGPSLAYHLWSMSDGGGDWVDGERIVHAKANVDRNIKRGIPDAMPLGEDLDGARKLLRNMTVTAQDQAAVAWLEKFPTATLEQVRNLLPTAGASSNPPVAANIPWWMSDGRGGSINRFRGGAVIRTEGNRQFESSPYSQGVPNYIEVLQASLRAMCVRWNLPEYMTGKANDVNFAAALTTGSPFSVAVEGGQLEFGLCWEKPVAMKVLELARDAGLLTYEEWRQLDVEVEEPALVTPEPDKDALRITSLVAAKLLSPQTAQLQLQLDPQHESENMAAVAKQQMAMMPQQPPGPGGAPPAGGPNDQPPDAPPDNYGGSFGRANLMKKTVVDKNGGQRTVWVSRESADVLDWLVESEKKNGEDDEAYDRAALIAEILASVFGDDAEGLFDDSYGGEPVAESRLVEAWDAIAHPRGKGGRFIPKNSPEAAAAAKEEVGKALKGKATPESVKKLTEHLSILTVAQLHALKKEHGISASAKDRGALVDKIADRLNRGRRTDEPEPVAPDESNLPPVKVMKARKKRGPVVTGTLHGAVLNHGGIDPHSISFLAHMSHKEAIENKISPFLFKSKEKGGKSLDSLVRSLVSEGHLPGTFDMDSNAAYDADTHHKATEFLLEGLKAGGYSYTADREKDNEAAELAFSLGFQGDLSHVIVRDKAGRVDLDASIKRAEQHDPEAAEALRRGQESANRQEPAGDREGVFDWDGDVAGGAQSERPDDSFDFGELEKPDAAAPAVDEPSHDDPFAKRDLEPDLLGIKSGELAWVAGHQVRALPDGQFQVETGKGYKTGSLADTEQHIQDMWRHAAIEKPAADLAMERAASNPAPEGDWFGGGKQAEDVKRRRAAVPEGARGVSLEPNTRGRLGNVGRDEHGATHLKLDNSTEHKATDFEPLASQHSWRTPEKEKAAGAKNKQPELFDPKAAAPNKATPLASVPLPPKSATVTVKKNANGEGLTTHFEPGEPEAAAKKLAPSIHAAMAELKLDVEHSDGVIPLHRIVHEVKKEHPDASTRDIYAAMKHMQGTRELEGKALNETQKLNDPNFRVGGESSPDTGTLWNNDRALHYWAKGKGGIINGLARESLDRSKLTRSVITDKNGVERHVWIHPDDAADTKTEVELPTEKGGDQPDGVHVWSDEPELRKAADSHAARIIKAITSVPAAIMAKVRTKVSEVYAKLTERYGKTVARLAVGAGLIGLAIPLPGASMLMAAPVLAVAELHQRLWVTPKDENGKPLVSVTTEPRDYGTIRAAGEWFMKQVMGVKMREEIEAV